MSAIYMDMRRFQQRKPRPAIYMDEEIFQRREPRPVWGPSLLTQLLRKGRQEAPPTGKWRRFNGPSTATVQDDDIRQDLSQPSTMTANDASSSVLDPASTRRQMIRDEIPDEFKKEMLWERHKNRYSKASHMKSFRERANKGQACETPRNLDANREVGETRSEPISISILGEWW